MSEEAAIETAQADGRDFVTEADDVKSLQRQSALSGCQKNIAVVKI
jgi:hypothetical protein